MFTGQLHGSACCSQFRSCGPSKACCTTHLLNQTWVSLHLLQTPTRSSNPWQNQASQILNHSNQDGWTAAHIAASRGYKVTCSMLNTLLHTAENKSYRRLINTDGALHAYVSPGLQKCLEVLCNHSQQDMEKRDKCNRTIHDVATDDCKDLLENLGKYSSLSVGHSESRRMTDELGSRQRDLSPSSVTKRANGHWHAIIASSCRWSQREYKRQPVHRINHLSLRSRVVVFTTALPDATRSLRVRALRHSSGGRGLTGEQRSVKTVTQECAVASSPACFSTKRAKFL